MSFHSPCAVLAALCVAACTTASPVGLDAAPLDDASVVHDAAVLDDATALDADAAPGDAGHARDAGIDAAIARDAALDGGAAMAPGLVVEITAPAPVCADWAALAPAGALASADGEVVSTLLASLDTGTTALLPDGTLALVGVIPRTLTLLARDASIVWQRDLPPTGTLSSALYVAPDGTTFVPQPSDHGTFRVDVFDRDGTPGTEIVIDAGAHPGGLLGLAIGPAGRVYVATNEELLETCRGGDVIARAHGALADGTPAEVGLPVVEASGAVLVPVVGWSQLARFASGLSGADPAEWLGLPPDAFATTLRVGTAVPLSVVDGRVLMRVPWVDPPFGVELHAVLAVPGAPAVELPGGAIFIDALGRVIVEDAPAGLPGSWTYLVDGSVERVAPLGCGGIHTTDGSVLCLASDRVLQVAPDGSPSGSLPYVRAAPSLTVRSMHLDEGGVFWAVFGNASAGVGTELHVFQTSLRPTDDRVLAR